MAFTRSWDETFPQDTQQANLLGQDVRNSKIDIRERMSAFAAGTLGNRPTPDAVFVGVMYFSTDNGHMYRWNGASWDDITSTFLIAVPTGPADNAHLLRGDSVWSNVLVGDFTATNLNASGNITADNISLTNGVGNTLSRGGETGNAVISGSNVNITFQSSGGSDLDLYVNGVFKGHVSLF